MTNLIPFPLSQADRCRLHNNFFEIEEQRRPAPLPITTVTPTPYGLFLIALGIFFVVMR